MSHAVHNAWRDVVRVELLESPDKSRAAIWNALLENMDRRDPFDLLDGSAYGEEITQRLKAAFEGACTAEQLKLDIESTAKIAVRFGLMLRVSDFNEHLDNSEVPELRTRLTEFLKLTTSQDDHGLLSPYLVASSQLLLAELLVHNKDFTDLPIQQLEAAAVSLDLVVEESFEGYVIVSQLFRHTAVSVIEKLAANSCKIAWDRLSRRESFDAFDDFERFTDKLHFLDRTDISEAKTLKDTASSLKLFIAFVTYNQQAVDNFTDRDLMCLSGADNINLAKLIKECAALKHFLLTNKDYFEHFTDRKAFLNDFIKKADSTCLFLGSYVLAEMGLHSLLAKKSRIALFFLEKARYGLEKVGAKMNVELWSEAYGSVLFAAAETNFKLGRLLPCLKVLEDFRKQIPDTHFRSAAVRYALGVIKYSIYISKFRYAENVQHTPEFLLNYERATTNRILDTDWTTFKRSARRLLMQARLHFDSASKLAADDTALASRVEAATKLVDRGEPLPDKSPFSLKL